MRQKQRKLRGAPSNWIAGLSGSNVALRSIKVPRSNLQSLAGLDFHIISFPRRSHELLDTRRQVLIVPHCLDGRAAPGQPSGWHVEQVRLADLSVARLLAR